jgi:hypothetical protein
MFQKGKMSFCMNHITDFKVCIKLTKSQKSLTEIAGQFKHFLS